MHARMGLEKLSGPSDRRDVDLLADTGALYSLVSGALLRELGIEPRERMTFELADGRTMERAVGEARFFYNGRNAVSPVIFGEEGDGTLLGVVTLESLGLEVDPVRRQIRPARMILY
jgi:predicted aspartyl protease